MRSFFTFVILISLLFAMANCSKKSSDKSAFNQKDTLTSVQKVESSNFSKDSSISNTNNRVKPIDFKTIEQIFPKKIGNLILQKTNKGQIINQGIKYNSVSAEYVSINGPIIIYCYDYLLANNLPDYLRNLTKIHSGSSSNEDIFYIANGKGKLLQDQLTGGNKCDIVYSDRFHIQIEAINYSNFRNEVIDIINNLNLSKLNESSK